MIGKYLIILISVTIFLSLVALVLFLLSGKEGIAKNGEKGKLAELWNLFQGWNAKRIAKWAFGIFGIFLAFELVVLLFGDPNFSLIRKLVSIARGNDVNFQINRVRQNKIAAETQRDRKELSEIYDNVEEAEKLGQKIKDTETKYDPSKKTLQPQRRLSPALRGKVYMSDHEGSAQAKIVFLDDVQLVVRYAYHCEIRDYVGKFDGRWSEEEKSYIGMYIDTTERGTMKFKPFASSSKEIYRLDGQYKKEGGDKWISVTITHQEGIGATHNCSTKS